MVTPELIGNYPLNNTLESEFPMVQFEEGLGFFLSLFKNETFGANWYTFPHWEIKESICKLFQMHL